MTADKTPKVTRCFRHPLGGSTTPDGSIGLQDVGGLTEPCYLVGAQRTPRLPSAAASSSSKKPQPCQDYSSLECVPSAGLEGLGAQRWTHLPPLSGPSQPSSASRAPCRSIFLGIPKGSLRERGTSSTPFHLHGDYWRPEKCFKMI